MSRTFIDLFAGAGGLSEGFERAGALGVGFVELSDAASKTHEANTMASRLHDDVTTFLVGTDSIPSCDLVVGSPPCPTFSAAGRASLANREGGFEQDKRTELWRHWARVVKLVQPAAALMENVPGFLHHLGENYAELVAAELKGTYHVWYTVVDAAAYGVPQHRERMFLMALHRDFARPDAASIFPGETHRARRRKTPWRAVAHVEPAVHVHWRMTLPPPDGAPQAVTVRQAFDGLGAPPLAPMRRALGLMDGTPQAHLYRHASVRDTACFSIMEPGDDYAVMMRKAKELEEAGTPIEVPPHRADKFKQKWQRLLPDQPAHTLLANLHNTPNTQIHPWEDRTISVREAARLQSFPDSFVFPVKLTDAMRQIGNAVPPRLAEHFARTIMEHIK